MEKTTEEKQKPAKKESKNKKLLVTILIVVAVLLVAGTAYLVYTMLYPAKEETKDTKLVAPAKVMTTLEDADKAVKKAQEAHINAAESFNTPQNRLVD